MEAMPWCSGYLYCTPSFNKAQTQLLRRFESCLRRVGNVRWWGSLTMVLAGNKAKRFSSVNHTKKQFTIIIIIIIIIIISNSYFFVIRVKIYKFKARNDKCWRECKDPGKHIGWKSCIWNPSTCTCESSKYQESSIGDTVIMCNKIIGAKITY